MPELRRRPSLAAGARAVLCAAILGALTLVASRSIAQSFGIHPLSGRVFARVMSAEGADWLDRRERIEEEAPDLALDTIGIAVGSTVADIGAGSGYFSVRLASRVGASGKVYATDIQPAMLD